MSSRPRTREDDLRNACPCPRCGCRSSRVLRTEPRRRAFVVVANATRAVIAFRLVKQFSSRLMRNFIPSPVTVFKPRRIRKD